MIRRILALGEFDLSRNFLLTLAERGIDVRYCHIGNPRMPESHPRLDILRIPRRENLPAVMEQIDTFGPDVLYVGSAGYDGSNALALTLLNARPRLPIVRVYKEFTIQASARESEVLTGCDGVVLHSEAVAGYFSALYGLRREKVHIYDHDVIADRLIPASLPTGKLRDQDGEPHVVLGGTMKNDGSGYDYRDFIAELADRRVHVHVYPVAYSRWLSVGRVLDSDSAEVRAEYEAVWNHPYVHREEPLPQRDMLDVWARYDAGIMQVRPRTYVPTLTPWQQMDHPSKHSYYLSAGLPVAADRAVLSSLRRHLAPHGVMLDYGDVDELATLLHDGLAVAAAGERARAHRRDFGISAGLDALLDFMAQVATRVKEPDHYPHGPGDDHHTDT